MSLVHLVQMFGWPMLGLLRGELTSLVSLLLVVCNLAGDCLLLAGLVSLGGVFHAIRRGSETDAPPP
jgi:hypothetical protein